MITSGLELGARLVHSVGAILWIGSIYFSASALHQRAPALFERDEDFEAFITGLSDGNRARHLVAFSASLISGIALTLLSATRYPQEQALWMWSLIALKGVLFMGSAMTFGYISWRLWPQRIFATPGELKALRRRGAQARWLLWGSLMLAAVIGALLTHARA